MEQPARSRSTLVRYLRALMGILTVGPLPQVSYAFGYSAVLAVVLLPVRSLARWPREASILVGLGLVGVAAFYISAAWHRTPVPNLSALSFIALTLMVIGVGRVVADVESALVQTGWVAVGVVGFFVLIGTENSSDSFNHLWKYGVGVPITMIVLVVAQRLGARLWLVVVLTLALCGVSIFLGFRSLGLTAIVALVLALVKTGSTSRGQGVFKFGIAVVALYLVSVALPFAIDSGILGDAVRQRTEEQASTGASPLLAGRVEPPLSIAAVLARPFDGWGNLNAIDGHTFDVARSIAASLGLQNPGDYANLWVRANGDVSVHSVFFEAWVQGGIFAVLMPAFLVYLFVRGIIAARGKYSLVVTFVCIQGIWDRFFSTWGATRPMVFAASAFVAIWAIQHGRDARSGGPSLPVGRDMIVGRSNSPLTSAGPVRSSS